MFNDTERPTTQEQTLPLETSMAQTDFVRKIKKTTVGGVDTWTSANIEFSDFEGQVVETATEAAKGYADAAKVSEDNAKQSETNASTSESNASTSAANALTSEQNAATSEQNAATSEQNAATSEANALSYKNAAEGAAGTATTKAGEASQDAADADASRVLAQSAELTATTKAAEASVSATTALNAASATILGGIAYNATAPTPGKSGKYYFTTAGSCTWLTGGAASVLIGQEVLVVFTSPSTYTYTLLAVTANYMYKNEVTFKNTSIADLNEREIFGNEIPSISGFYILPTTGEVAASAAAICTEKIPITPATISLYGAQIAGNSRGCVYYDENQAKLKPLRPNGVECTYYRFEDNDGNATISNLSINGTFQQPATAKYMQFTLTFNTVIDYTTLKISFTPRRMLGVLTGDASQSANKTDYAGASIPLISNFYRSSTTGELTATTGAKASDLIQVKGRVLYVNSADLGTNGIRGLVFFDENGSKIKPLRPNGVECATYKLENNAGVSVQNGNFPIPINAKWISFTAQLSTAVDINTLSISFGFAKLPHKFVVNDFMPYSRIVRFSYNVNTENPLIVPSDDISVLDTESMGKDWAVLMLPENYDPNGAPVRLIISCHGGGGTVTETTSACETFNMNMYFVNQGYAVMDCGGMPESYAASKAIDWYRCLGSYFTVNSYERAYSHVAKNYNIYKDGVLLHGGSNGGLTALNIHAHSNIPVRAMSGMSALLSMDNAWSIPSGGGNYGTFASLQNRANMIRIYGMTPITTQEQLNAAVIERDKITGFDPINHNVFRDYNGSYCKIHDVPIKLWQPIDDPIIDYTLATEFVNRIKNAGGYAILRLMESGGHSPENAGAVIGSFIYNGETQYIHPPMVELVNWMNRHK